MYHVLLGRQLLRPIVHVHDVNLRVASPEGRVLPRNASHGSGSATAMVDNTGGWLRALISTSELRG